MTELALHLATYGSLSLFGRYQERVTSVDKSAVYIDHTTSAKIVFETLCEKWKEQTEILSSYDEIVGNIFYKKIIDMGWKAIPFIFERMEEDHDFWFEALTSITGHDPIDEENYGDVSKMCAIWLEWARENGFDVSTNPGHVPERPKV